MLYFRSRMVWAPPPSDHIPFRAALAWSSRSHSLACSGLQWTKCHAHIHTHTHTDSSFHTHTDTRTDPMCKLTDNPQSHTLRYNAHVSGDSTLSDLTGLLRYCNHMSLNAFNNGMLSEPSGQISAMYSENVKAKVFD